MDPFINFHTTSNILRFCQLTITIFVHGFKFYPCFVEIVGFKTCRQCQNFIERKNLMHRGKNEIVSIELLSKLFERRKSLKLTPFLSWSRWWKHFFNLASLLEPTSPHLLKSVFDSMHPMFLGFWWICVLLAAANADFWFHHVARTFCANNWLWWWDSLLYRVLINNNKYYHHHIINNINL